MFSNFITITVRHADGSETETAPFFNHLLDSYLAHRIGDVLPTLSLLDGTARCVVGTGTTPPTNGDTAMEAPVATSTTLVPQGVDELNNPYYYTTGYDIVQATDTPFIYVRCAFEFPVGSVSTTLTEVGFGTATDLMSRALITDDNGVPTPLPVAATDYLLVRYNILFAQSASTADTVMTGVSIGGSNYDITIRPIDSTSAAVQNTYATPDQSVISNTTGIAPMGFYGIPENWLGSFDGADTMPAHDDPWSIGLVEQDPSLVPTLAAYTPLSGQRDISVSIGQAFHNHPNGIGFLRVSTSEGDWGIGFSPPLPKSAANTLNLTVTVQAAARCAP